MLNFMPQDDHEVETFDDRFGEVRPDSKCCYGG